MFLKDRKTRNLSAGVQLRWKSFRVEEAKADRKGFTLMEMLIALSVFAFTTVSSLSIYMAVIKASQKTIALSRVQQEAQFIMQVLAKKIRTSRLDYNYYGTVLNPEDTLALIDLTDDQYIFALDAENDILQVTVGGVTKDIPASNVLITGFDVYINPTTDPFTTLDEPPSSHPYVTIVMSVSSSKGGQTAGITVQQTVPQRSGGE